MDRACLAAATLLAGAGLAGCGDDSTSSSVQSASDTSNGCTYTFHDSTRYIGVLNEQHGLRFHWPRRRESHGPWSAQQRKSHSDNVEVDRHGYLHAAVGLGPFGACLPAWNAATNPWRARIAGQFKRGSINGWTAVIN